MKIEDIMTAKPHTISPSSTLLEAAQQMQVWRCGILPVKMNENVIGVVTDRDILTRAIVVGKDVESTLVKDIMTLDPIFCEAQDKLESAIQKMDKHHTRRVLVKNKNGTLMGILSLGDIFRRVREKNLLSELFIKLSVD